MAAASSTKYRTPARTSFHPSPRCSSPLKTGHASPIFYMRHGSPSYHPDQFRSPLNQRCHHQESAAPHSAHQVSELRRPFTDRQCTTTSLEKSRPVKCSCIFGMEKGNLSGSIKDGIGQKWRPRPSKRVCVPTLFAAPFDIMMHKQQTPNTSLLLELSRGGCANARWCSCCWW